MQSVNGAQFLNIVYFLVFGDAANILHLKSVVDCLARSRNS